MAIHRLARLRDSLTITTNVLVLGAMCVFWLRPDGPVSRWKAEREANAERREWIAYNWDKLTEAPSRLGSAEAEVQLVEFVDYECPACTALYRELKLLVEHHSEVGVVVRHLPLPSHAVAARAAGAAICAQRYGRFAEIHGALLTSEVDKKPLLEIARAIGIPDLSAFADCLGSEAVTSRLSRDKALARSLGVSSLPTIVTRGASVLTTGSAQDLERLLGLPSRIGKR